MDPNEIYGPKGFGAAGYVAPTVEFYFKISFENMKNATAPAQRVYVKYNVDANVDIESIRFGNVQFGSTITQFNNDKKALSNDVPVVNVSDYYVHIEAYVNKTDRSVIWILQSLDPETKEPPEDALAGFLPPNNNRSDGEGNVNLFVKPKQNPYMLPSFLANATIIFDLNDPISTNVLRYTIDDISPRSSVAVIQNETQKRIWLNIQAEDEGVGVKSIELYAKTESSEKEKLIAEYEFPCIVPVPDELLTGIPTTIFTIARDFVGNVEIKRTFDVINYVFPLRSIPCPSDCSGNGQCNSNIGMCICYENFTGEACTIPITRVSIPSFTFSIENSNLAGESACFFSSFYEDFSSANGQVLQAKLTGIGNLESASRGVIGGDSLTLSGADFDQAITLKFAQVDSIQYLTVVATVEFSNLDHPLSITVVIRVSPRPTYSIRSEIMLSNENSCWLTSDLSQMSALAILTLQCFDTTKVVQAQYNSPYTNCPILKKQEQLLDNVFIVNEIPGLCENLKLTYEIICESLGTSLRLTVSAAVTHPTIPSPFELSNSTVQKELIICSETEVVTQQVASAMAALQQESTPPAPPYSSSIPPEMPDETTAESPPAPPDQPPPGFQVAPPADATTATLEETTPLSGAIQTKLASFWTIPWLIVISLHLIGY